MGNTFTPVSEEEQNRINETVEDVCTRFAKEFPAAYTQAVVKKQKLALTESKVCNFKLDNAEVMDGILKEGILTKRGDSVKTWKSRFFQAFNAKDNWKIEYREGSDENGKLKGTIYCARYHASEFTAADVKEQGGEKGIKLVPHSSRLRTWWIRCADDKQRSEWLSVFRTACHKAECPRDKDECIATAFDVTLRNMRYHYWFWGWDADAGSEEVRLGAFMMDLLKREILDALIGKIPDGPQKSLTVDTFLKTIGASVNTAAKSCWISSAGAVRAMSQTINDNVKNLIQPVVEQETIIKTSIVDLVGGTVNPFFVEKGSSIFTPIIGVIVKPLTTAYIAAITEFASLIPAKMSDGKLSDTAARSVRRDTDYRNSYMSSSIKTFDALVDGPLVEIAAALGSVSHWTVYNILVDNCRELMHNAITTLRNLTKEATDTTEAVNKVLAMVFHDSFFWISKTICDVFSLILSPLVSENVLRPCKELIAPVQEVVDALPVPGLSTLLDSSALLEEVVSDLQISSVEAIISAALAEAKTALDAAQAEAGIAAMSL